MDTYSIYDFYELIQGMCIILVAILGILCFYALFYFSIEKTKLALTLLILNIVSIIVCLYFFIYMAYLQIR